MKKIIIIALFLMACNENKTPPRPTPIVKDTEFCELAGKNLQEQDCIDNANKFTPAGKSFCQFCKDKHSEGVYLNPQCLANIRARDRNDCREQMNVCTYSK